MIFSSVMRSLAYTSRVYAFRVLGITKKGPTRELVSHIWETRELASHTLETWELASHTLETWELASHTSQVKRPPIGLITLHCLL